MIGRVARPVWSDRRWPENPATFEERWNGLTLNRRWLLVARRAEGGEKFGPPPLLAEAVSTRAQNVCGTERGARSRLTGQWARADTPVGTGELVQQLNILTDKYTGSYLSRYEPGCSEKA